MTFMMLNIQETARSGLLQKRVGDIHIPTIMYVGRYVLIRHEVENSVIKQSVTMGAN